MKVTNVKKAQKAVGKCGRCGDEIARGAPYSWTKARYGPKQVRCAKPACAFRASDLTGSDKLARLYAARESVEDALASALAEHVDDGEAFVDALTSALEDAANEAREVGSEYEESASNMQQAFPSGSLVIDEIDEKARACETYADALENAKDEIVDIFDSGDGTWNAEKRDAIEQAIESAKDELTL